MAGLSQRSEDSMWWKVCRDGTKGGKEMPRKERSSELSETKKHLKVLHPHPWGVQSERESLQHHLSIPLQGWMRV